MDEENVFAGLLYERMKGISPAVEDLAPYEFRYALDNLRPEPGGWTSVALRERAEIEEMVSGRAFYEAIQLKPRVGDRIVLDDRILRLTVMLCAGLVTGAYPVDWVREHFYFDVRGFFFLHRTRCFTHAVLAHLGGSPVMSFERKQARFERFQAVGYKDFEEANAEVDHAFQQAMRKLIGVRGTPILAAIAGPTAAGKTEIVGRLRQNLEGSGHTTAAIEMDNFLTDREQREERGIHSLGREAVHYELFTRSLDDIGRGLAISIPRYDFVNATSSHDLDGRLKAGCAPLAIGPADVVFIEGNFPFLLPEVAPLIAIKVVYLTDDPVRLKRKWKRDIDYRKKYEPTYFRNRFFREQFLMAQQCYVPQMEACDLVVDTTGAAIWATPETASLLAAE